MSLGPDLPFGLVNPTMVTSPTEKGIVVIGGEIDEDFELQKGSSNALLELSRNSKGDLSWNILEQNLQFPRSHHVCFYVPDQMVTHWKTLYEII